MTDGNAPMVPAEVDLRDFPFMPLEIERLRRSKQWLKAKRCPELGFYMLNLWMGSWHNVPAGSLEDDDDVLCDMAGCDVKRWAKVRADVLRGWVKCSDGRLYHAVVAEKACAAWERKVAQRKRTAKATEARWKRDGDAKSSVTESVTETVTDAPRLPSREREGEGERDTALPQEISSPSAAAVEPAAADDLAGGLASLRDCVSEAFETWFDAPDRPITPSDEDLLTEWLEHAASRGMAYSEAAAVAGEAVRAQFEQIAKRDIGEPRSLRAVLDKDVRIALNAAVKRPAKAAAPAAEAPAPYAGHITATEYSRWIAPCTVSVSGRTATFIAPNRAHADWLVQRLDERLRAALDVGEIVAEVAAAPKATAEVIPLKRAAQ